MSGSVGEINGWHCNGVANRGGKVGEPSGDYCGRHTYVVHADEGVTPMFLACRAEGVDPDEAECKGMGISLMYPPSPYPEHIVEAVAWEWYSPDAAKLATLNEGLRDHVEKGGVLLRPLTDAGRAVLQANDGVA